MPRKKIDVWGLWASARSLASIQRYHGAKGVDPDNTEQSIASASKATTREIVTINDPTLGTPFLDEAAIGGNSNSNSSANAVEDKSSQNRRPTWIRGVYFCANATVGLLLLNTILISVVGGLASKHRGSGGSSNSKVVYEGSCVITSRWNTAFHFIINAISTCILAASNYCMQTLIAPTRDEVDLFHAKRRWLDIGGSSFRNLFAIPFNRLGLWLILLITATPFHLLYNSVIFESLSFNEYWAFVAPSDFDAQNVRNLTTPALEKCFGADVWGLYNLNTKESIDWDGIVQVIMKERSERLSPEQCYGLSTKPSFGHSATYGVSHFPSGYKGLIYLASDLFMNGGGDTSVLRPTGRYKDQSVKAVPFSYPSIPTRNSHECTVDAAYYDIAPLYRTHSLSGCLAFEGKKNCQLLLSPSIAVIVSLAALMKVFAMYLAAHLQRSRAPPLLTTGDAVASFLERPDDTTKGMCWASKRHIRKGMSRQYRHLSPPRQWRKASSPFHWLATSMIFVGCSVVAIGLPAVRLPSAVANPQGLWDYESNVKGTGAFVSGTVSEMQGVVTANSVQLLVTAGYYFYNSVLTSMLASAEYSSYGTDRKPLRVTWPVKGSQQRSTYWLSVPYKYGIPVMILFMAIHWFVSQAFYYVLLIPYSPDDQPLYGEKFSSLGASVLPMFIAGLVGLVLFILLLCLAFRRLKSTIPLAGSCSAAISAACHPPEDVCNATAAHGELLWGETSLPRDCVDDQNDGCDLPRGHCSFTPLDARQPSLNKLYA